MSYEVRIAYTDQNEIEGEKITTHETLLYVAQEIANNLNYIFHGYLLTEAHITVTHRPATEGAERGEKGIK